MFPQDPFWKEVQPAFLSKKRDIDDGKVAAYDVAVKIAKRFLRNLPGV